MELSPPDLSDIKLLGLENKYLYEELLILGGGYIRLGDILTSYSVFNGTF